MNGKIVNGRKLLELYIINIFNMMEEDMNKPYDVGFICGRFQTFHKGHEKLVETGLMLCDRLLILLEVLRKTEQKEIRSTLQPEKKC